MMPRASDHLQYTTWPRRGDPKVSPESAWSRGKPLDITHAPMGAARVPQHDEARYDPRTETVLWRRQNVLTTCYSITKGDITNDHGQAALEAVSAQHGTPPSHHPEAHEREESVV